MKVSEIMHQPVHMPGIVSVAAAAQVMQKKKVDSIIVDDGRLGIFTEHDILHKVVAVGHDPAHISVSEIMSSPLKTIEASAYVDEASDLMQKYGTRRLVVLDGTNIVGIINAECIAKNIRYLSARRMISHFENFEATE